MKKCVLRNGVKLIYEHRETEITSFCIGFNAGAQEEIRGFKLGVAHAVEHMIYKGTVNRSEMEINKLCDEIFGFQNAMTNFPYVVYYGTCLSQDFERGIELFSDILLNPRFPKNGFKEEMNIILQELKEWKDDIQQHCEDSLLYNAFNKIRIKDLIIGNERSIEHIKIKDIEEFYKTYYTPNNCVISVCSSLQFNEVLETINNYFECWETAFNPIKKEEYEDNNEGIFVEKVPGITGAKIQYIFKIDSLDENEIKALTLFNEAFGDGTSSILFEQIRTNNGMAYEVRSSIKNERGIKLFTISMGTSSCNVEKAIQLVDKSIENIKNKKAYFNEDNIRQLGKRTNLKRQLKLEKSIQLCKELTTYELMYGSAEKVYNEVSNLELINEQDILKVLNKILKKPTVQVILPS
ncbi:pitrilysin family protein [Clostridium sp. DJ247]|uniref:M16 family metallopeptidase n=1 Tax=Clostridium sp. DJ247 TaxID=2726188 RepID=UPI0016272D79|nr:pitrilysin family protein [Clostridium sp. DJ247]MBC2581599.1 insulinase family protein [Clostridium sp. DJ247]